MSNREIKFRAWDVAGEYMVTSETGVASIVSKRIRSGMGLQNGNGKGVEKSDHVLMQFTGLKDKNGREIFEGDIIESLWVVRWHDGGFVLDDNGAKEEFSAATVRHDSIIGNIYEHPKLLETPSIDVRPA